MRKKVKRVRRRDEIQAILDRAKYLRGLLHEFGANLCGFDPGVTATLPGVKPMPGADGAGYFGEALCFNKVQWDWLEPLLLELKETRDEQ